MKEIKELAKRFSDEEIAVKIGVSARTVFNWKTGKTEPYRRDRVKILELLKEKKAFRAA